MPHRPVWTERSTPLDPACCRKLIELTGSPQRVLTIADPQSQVRRAVHRRPGGPVHQALEQATKPFAEGRFTMPVALRFPLAGTAEAHKISEDGHVRRKLVLVLD
jgi:NADPH:quinone reductase-like Zn-dependent oxidoreductase